MPVKQLLAASLTGALALAVLVAGPAATVAQAQGQTTPVTPAGAKQTPAATVGGEVITMEQLEYALSGKLAALDRQRHELLSDKLEEFISERLLAQEAAKRGVTVEQLIATADSKAADVSDDEVTSWIIQNRARIPGGMDEREVKAKVKQYLRMQSAGKARQEYVQSLRAQGQVTVMLKEPPEVRLVVSPDKGIVKGPRDARVAIVEFTDFQCPYCKQVNGTIRQLLADYKDKVKLVFRDFPVPSSHPGAPKAHAAARCANAQGKFWEYHDLLFERSPQHAPADLKRYAEELKLDTKAFADCVDGARYDGDVAADMQEGDRLGVTGTPTFFINGVQLVGALPIEHFKRLIDKELTTKAP